MNGNARNVQLAILLPVIVIVLYAGMAWRKETTEISYQRSATEARLRAQNGQFALLRRTIKMSGAPAQPINEVAAQTLSKIRTDAINNDITINNLLFDGAGNTGLVDPSLVSNPGPLGLRVVGLRISAAWEDLNGLESFLHEFDTGPATITAMGIHGHRVDIVMHVFGT